MGRWHRAYRWHEFILGYCIVISVLTGGITSSISIAYACADEQIPGIQRATIVGFSAYTLGHIFEHIVIPILPTATSWDFPAVLAIIPIVSTILSWITLYS